MTHIFLIAGAPAVGKSTTARALAARFPKSLHIPVDTLREMVVSGLALPGGDWSAALVEQLALARQTAVQMALGYSRAGFTVVMDDFWDPASRLQEYTEAGQATSFHKILLFPSRQAAQERNLKRSGPGGTSEYIAAGISLVYESLEKEIEDITRQGWLVLDTSGLSIDATVDLIRSRVGGRE